MRALGAVPREGTRRDRGSVLLAVLLVLVLACLIGTSIGLRASAEADAGMFRVHAAQARSAAWSGVLAAMVELESKRLDLLGGAAPGVTGTATRMLCSRHAQPWRAFKER